MSFCDGKKYKEYKKYTVRSLSKGHRHWEELQEVVDKKINRKRGIRNRFVITELYDVRWREKPFPWSWHREFKPNRRFFFHGTSIQAIKRILDEGFRVVDSAKHGRMLGDGVYVAYHTNKGFGYAPEGYVLSVMIYAPNTLVVDPGKTITDEEIKRARHKYDAVEVRTDAIVRAYRMLNHEICVFDPRRVIPRFILRLEINQ